MSVLKQRVRSKVLVTTKSSGSFEGVLWDHDREALILRSAQLLHPGGNKLTPVDGELLIFMADVAYLQVL